MIDVNSLIQKIKTDKRYTIGALVLFLLALPLLASLIEGIIKLAVFVLVAELVIRVLFNKSLLDVFNLRNTDDNSNTPKQD